jgi:hypothetical protein
VPAVLTLLMLALVPNPALPGSGEPWRVTAPGSLASTPAPALRVAAGQHECAESRGQGTGASAAGAAYTPLDSHWGCGVVRAGAHGASRRSKRQGCACGGHIRPGCVFRPLRICLRGGRSKRGGKRVKAALAASGGKSAAAARCGSAAARMAAKMQACRVARERRAEKQPRARRLCQVPRQELGWWESWPCWWQCGGSRQRGEPRGRGTRERRECDRSSNVSSPAGAR